MNYSKEELQKMRQEGEEYLKQREREQQQKQEGIRKPKELKANQWMPNKFSKMVFALLTISLLFNYVTIQKVNDLEKMVDFYSGEYRNLSDDMMQFNLSLSQQIHDLTEAAKWIEQVDFEPNQVESDPENIVLKLRWSLRENEEGAVISLLYKGEQDEGWEEVQADPLDLNTFHATIHLNPKKDYDFRISSKGRVNQLSEIDEIPEHYYKPTSVALTGIYSTWSSSSPNDRGKLTHFEASYSQEHVAFDFYKVKEIKAHYYVDEQLQKTETLTKTKNANNFDEWSLKADPEITLIKTEIIYENGEIEWHEIDPYDEDLLGPISGDI